MLRGAFAHYELSVHDQITTTLDYPNDYVVLEREALFDREMLWEHLCKSLIECVTNKRNLRRGRGRPARGPGWSLVGYYPDQPQLTPAQVLLRKARELGGGQSQRALGKELGISAITVWRIIADSGIGWPLPLN